MKTATQPRIIYSAPSEGFFDIPGVVYRGEAGNYRLFERMTPAMTQDQLAELYEREKPKGNPHPTDAPLIRAISFRGFDLRNESPQEAERLKTFLRNGFREYPNTLSRVIYNPKREDEIIHNYKTSDQYSLKGNVIGSDGFIADIADKKVLESLLGTEDIDKINEFSNWINGTNSRIWRLNLKPEQKDERVVSFNAYSDRFYLYCDRDPLYECPAFRVLKVE